MFRRNQDMLRQLRGLCRPRLVYQQFMDQGLGLKVGPGPATGPNPALAGILAGFFPFGVGAVYCSQYAKGLAHLVIMVLLIIGVSSDVPWYVHMVLGIGIGFFYLYQIIDAVRTAKAIQMGEPAPDPFGLASMFGTGGGAPTAAGEQAEGTKIPIAAAVLIGLGVLFLVNTAFDFSLHRYWPLILIGLGVWMFAQQLGPAGRISRTLRLRSLPNSQAHGPGDPDHSGRALLAGRSLYDRLWQDLARNPAGHRCGETGAEQCFVHWPRWPTSAGSSGISAQYSTAGGDAGHVPESCAEHERRTGYKYLLFERGEKCLAL